MSTFIEFTTQHNELTYGNPIHDGNLPKRFHSVEGIRVDGEPIDFVDPTIPDRLHRYFVESPKLRWRRIANDCVAFVALMNSVELNGRKHNPFSDFDQTSDVDPLSSDPIVLARGFHDGVVIPVHIVLPTPLASSEFGALHKLGDKGPVCMSSVNDAMDIMECSRAFPVKKST